MIIQTFNFLGNILLEDSTDGSKGDFNWNYNIKKSYCQWGLLSIIYRI